VAGQPRSFATAASIRAQQGPAVLDMDLPYSGETVLMRRVDLARLIGTGVWPEPITSEVRRLMIHGTQDWTNESEQIEKTLAAAAALVRAAIIVPPPALLAGEIEVKDITADMCRPLFVTEDPDDDQLILVAPGDPEPGDAGPWARLHPSDLSWLAARISVLVPGALAAFRGQQGNPVESVAAKEVDGAPDERAD